MEDRITLVNFLRILFSLLLLSLLTGCPGAEKATVQTTQAFKKESPFREGSHWIWIRCAPKTPDCPEGVGFKVTVLARSNGTITLQMPVGKRIIPESKINIIDLKKHFITIGESVSEGSTHTASVRHLNAPTTINRGGLNYNGPGSVWAAVFSSDNRRVKALFSGFTGINRRLPVLRTWELDPPFTATECSLPDYLRPSVIGFSQERDLMLVGYAAGGVALIDVDTCHQIRTFNTGEVKHVTFSPDGQQAFVAARDEFQLWNLTVPNEVQRIPSRLFRHTYPYAGTFPLRIEGSPDKRKLILVLASITRRASLIPSVIVCLDSKNLTELWHFECVDAEDLSLAVSPDGQRVLVGYKQGNIRLLDMATGRSLTVWTAPDGITKSLAFSSDGRKVISGGQDGVLRIWDSSRGTILKSYQVGAKNSLNMSGTIFEADQVDAKKNLDTILTVGLSTDGRRVLAGSINGLFVWPVSGL